MVSSASIVSYHMYKLIRLLTHGYVQQISVACASYAVLGQASYVCLDILSYFFTSNGLTMS